MRVLCVSVVCLVAPDLDSIPHDDDKHAPPVSAPNLHDVAYSIIQLYLDATHVMRAMDGTATHGAAATHIHPHMYVVTKRDKQSYVAHAYMLTHSCSCHVVEWLVYAVDAFPLFSGGYMDNQHKIALSITSYTLTDTLVRHHMLDTLSNTITSRIDAWTHALSMWSSCQSHDRDPLASTRSFHVHVIYPTDVMSARNQSRVYDDYAAMLGYCHSSVDHLLPMMPPSVGPCTQLCRQLHTAAELERVLGRAIQTQYGWRANLSKPDIQVCDATRAAAMCMCMCCLLLMLHVGVMLLLVCGHISRRCDASRCTDASSLLYTTHACHGSTSHR